MMTSTLYATNMTTTTSTTIDLTTTIQKLEERYPFNRAELEILLRCYEHVGGSKEEDKDDFLMKLALASPYSFFFVPGDEMRKRVSWIEDYVLPPGFANELRSAIAVDAFVEYANQGEDRSLERFIEGISDTGRRGPKEALRALFNLVDQPQPEELADFCIRIAVASDSLIEPNLNETEVLNRLEDFQPAVEALSVSLTDYCKGEPLTSKVFVLWAEEYFPLLSAPLSTFVHNLLFHGHSYPKTRIPYKSPKLDTRSDIFRSLLNSPALMTLSFTSPQFGGKVSCYCCRV
jgi:hypothetical protein